MLNDWKWEKINNNKYIIRDSNNLIIVDLIKNQDKTWSCIFYNNELNLKYKTNFSKSLTIFSENMTIEEAQWRSIIWIYNQCNNIANSFYYIRDHLPSYRELATKYFDKSTKI